MASLTAPFGRPTRIASAPFRVGHKPYPAGYGFPSPFGSRRSLLDPSLSRWGFGPRPRGRLAAGHAPADPIGVYTFRMGRSGRGGCLLYAEVFGVLEPGPTTNPGANVTTHHRFDRAFGDLLLFRRVDEDSLISSPVRPSPDPVRPPDSGSPWTSPAASHRSLPILHAPDGDGIEHYPGSLLFEPLPTCDLVSHQPSRVYRL